MFKAKKVTVPLQITIFIVHTFYITALVSMQKPLMKLCLMLQSTCTLNGAQYEPLIIQFAVIIHLYHEAFHLQWCCDA
jgi:hypothetical protein